PNDPMPITKHSLVFTLTACTTLLWGAPRLEASPQVPGQPFGGSPTAAAERMLGGTVRRGNSGFRVVRLSNGSHLGRSSDDCTSSLLGNLYEVTLYDTPNEWEEVFILGVPLNPETSLSPLLVGFHQFETSERDFCLNTGFFDEALGRGWYVAAPRGAVQYSFGYPKAQDNTELVLDFCLAYLGHAIDEDRIYGVGFSMGGTWMASQAARHLDASRGRFAALINHTGGVDVANIFDQSCDDDCDPPSCGGCSVICGSSCQYDIPDYLNVLFGGSPLDEPFAYRQVSLLEMISCSPAYFPGLAPSAWGTYGVGSWCVDGETDLGLNLLTTPMALFYLPDDGGPSGTVNSEQLDVLHDHMTNTLGGSLCELWNNDSGTTHDWGTLDVVTACDYLAGHSLSEPLAETTTTSSDRDARWYDMDVTQEAAEAFTRWTWHLDPDSPSGQQYFALFSTRNLATLKLHSADAGIDTSAGARAIKVTLLRGTGDDQVQSDEVLLTGFAAEPAVDISGAESPIFGEDYDYDPLTGELRLMEHAWPGNGLIDWLINP
ncbi:MAG: hypothetical protein QF599_09210, partial [Planctomycetota bacterium]|nr:hypothetical protein [Planctomycetota bacterium]